MRWLLYLHGWVHDLLKLGRVELRNFGNGAHQHSSHGTATSNLAILRATGLRGTRRGGRNNGVKNSGREEKGCKSEKQGRTRVGKATPTMMSTHYNILHVVHQALNGEQQLCNGLLYSSYVGHHGRLSTAVWDGSLQQFHANPLWLKMNNLQRNGRKYYPRWLLGHTNLAS